jgi:glycosyltransferase involved in cell wall biosynthesis
MNPSNPDISVLMSVYNSADLLPKALQSLLDQNHTQWELVVVDDGSSDDSLTILENFKKTVDQPVHILKNEKNLGLTKSLNKGLKIAKGKYIARLDADDWFHPKKLKKQFQFMEDHPDYGIVGSWYTNYFSDRKSSEVVVKPPTESKAIQKYLLFSNPFAHSAVMIRRDAFDVVGLYNESIRLGQDYELWWRFSKHFKMGNLNENLCFRLVETISDTDSKLRRQMVQSVNTRWRYMNRKNPLNYLYLVHPLLIAYTPNSIRKIVRKCL